MNRGLRILTLVVGIGAMPLSAQEGAQRAAAAEVGQPAPDIVLGVDGLACPFCAYGLEKKLKKLDGVEKVEVLLDDGEVHIFVKEGRHVTDAQLRAAVKDAGFSVREIKRAEQGDATSPARGAEAGGGAWWAVA